MNIDERIKNMLISDKHFDTKDMIKVIRNDMYVLLNNYLEISPQDILVTIKVNEYGEYELRVDVKTERLKIFGTQIN